MIVGRDKNGRIVKNVSKFSPEEKAERLRQLSRETYARNREKVIAKVKEYKSKRPWLKTYKNITNRCCADKEHHYYKKGIKRLIKPDELKTLWFRDKAYEMRCPSIDRIDSSKDYTLANCRYLDKVYNVRE